MFKPITVFSKETKENFTFSKENLVFGYAKAGKTTLLSNLENIFVGKDKHHLVNGTQVMPNDFNVIFLSSTDGISSHLKLSSKSFLRKLIQEGTYSDSFSKACNNIQESITVAQNEIEEKVKKVLPTAKVSVSGLDDSLTFLIDNINITLDDDSSTDEKADLFSVVNSLASSTTNQTIVIIDDFCKDFDEEMTMSFFTKLQETDACFILSSKKVIPQSLIKDDTTVFALREGKFICLPSLSKIITTSLTKEDQSASFEEYMTGQGYLTNAGLTDLLVKQIQGDEKSNILRILTSKQPIISKQLQDGKVTICPRSDDEEKIYKNVFSMLGISLDEK